VWAGIFSPAQAGLESTLPQVRPSVVAIGTFQRTRSPQFRLMGTGFAVGDGSTVVTNSHVVPVVLDVDHMEELIVIVFPNDGEQQVRKATKLRNDPSHDLALLKIEGAPLPPMRLGDAASVREGQEIAFTGFPIVGILGLTPATHRGIVSAITPIVIPQATAGQLNEQAIQRIRSGAFKVFQLDATAYPGNSGSPVFNPETGEVLAIINMTWVKGSKEAALTSPSGITYAVPVAFLKALVEQR
jgi:S1-C subfamily serine protease